MKFLVSLLFVSFAFQAYCQKDKIKSTEMNTDTLIKQMEERRKSMDSSMNAYYKMQDSINLKRTLEQNNRNLDAFMAEQRARKERETRGLWIRGGILLLALGVMIYSFIRRRKKKANSTPTN
jgi:hypothetical protein